MTQLEVAVFITSFPMFLLMAATAALGGKLNVLGTTMFVLSLFGLSYSIAGVFL